MSGSEGGAAAVWAQALRDWAIPDHILQAATRSPYGFSVGTFSRAADVALGRSTPTVEVAREALPEGGAVLDVGCGAGAASLPLAGHAALLVGVDESQEMLDAYADRVAATNATSAAIVGRWPDVAGEVPAVDVVVCRNVAYNVAELATFVTAMSERARRRVVLELTARHPLSWTAPFWKAIHDVDVPEGPNVDDALAVLSELGIHPGITRWDTPWLLATERDEVLVDFLLRRLCLGEDRAEEVRTLLGDHPAPATQPTATVWWEGSNMENGT